MIKILSIFLNWSLMALVVVSLNACDTKTQNPDSTIPTAEEIALTLIANYAQDGVVVPTVQNYEDAGVSGVDSSNLEQANSLILELSYSDVDTKEEIRAILAELEIELLDTPPSLINAPAQVYIKNVEIAKLSFANAANNKITSCNASSLPVGLSIAISSDGASCDIAGTPTAVQPATIHTISASNAGGDATASVSIEVKAALLKPSLSEMTALSFVVGRAIESLTLSNNGGGALTTCEADNLPSGLAVAISLDQSTCEITGTPTIVKSASTVTITASNPTGSDSTVVKISVVSANVVVDDVPVIDIENNKIQLSGVVQKGRFAELRVAAYAIDAKTGNKTEALDVLVNDQEYSLQSVPDQVILLEASGKFINDVDGEIVNLDKPLKVVVDVKSENVTANINVLTTLVAERVANTLAGGAIDSLQGNGSALDRFIGLSSSTSQSVGELITQQEGVVNLLFGLAETTEPDQLDYRNIQAGMNILDPNVQLLSLSAGIVKSIPGDEFFSDGFDAIVSDVANVSNNATMSNTLIPALSILNNIEASQIYRDVVQFSGYAYLPELVFNNSPVLNCIASRACSWSTQQSSTIQVRSQPAYEAEGRLKVTVSLGKASQLPVNVRLFTESGTAIDGVDYLGIDEVITFRGGKTLTEVDFDVIIDRDAEPAEALKLSIESLTPSYTVVRDSIDLSILDGSPAGSDDQDVSSLTIDSLSATFMHCSSTNCTPVQLGSLEADITNINSFFGSSLVFDADASFGLIEGKSQLLGVKIDISCASNQACPALDTNLLVDYYLVAKDTVGDQKGELALGGFLFDQDEKESAFVNIAGLAVENFSNTASQNDWGLEIEARLKSLPPSLSVLVSSIPIPSMVSVPDSVILEDGTEVTLITALGVSDVANVNCTDGDISIYGIYQQPTEYHITSNDEEAIIAVGNFCLTLDAENPTQNAATAVGGQLELIGFKLPNGLGWRESNDNAGVPIIANEYQLENPLLSFYLHHEGWPFEFETEKAYISFRGLEISYSDMRYIGSVDYSDTDPRRNNALFSNDIYYSGVKGQSGILQLTPEGVDTQFNVQQNQTSAKNTAYPRAKIKWQEFSQSIVKNKLQGSQIAVSNYLLKQSTECGESGCANDVPQNWQVSAATVKLDADGFLLGNAVNNTSNQDVVFGALPSGGFAWTRPDDLRDQQSMKMASPGYVIPATERVSDFLVSHLNEDENSEKIIRYPLGSDAFIDGNFHPVGLSLGPEIYRNIKNIPEVGDGQDLTIFNNKLSINNGVDEEKPFELVSSVAVKYVLRNSGLTGVFNVPANNLDSNADFYGYPLNLSRFAVRATDNKLDDYTWIDGRLALQGDAGGDEGLDLWFGNLEMNCAARLGNLELLAEACDDKDNNGNGVIDENCSPRLYSWNTETDIFAATFDGTEAKACATGNQRFVLDQQLFFKALNKPVVFQTEWDTAGKLIGQTSGELPKYRLDKSAGGKGFPIKTAGAKLGLHTEGDSGHGWLELKKSKLGVPFWNAMATDIQVANRVQFSDIVADPTLVVKEMTLDDLKTAAGDRTTNKQLQQFILDEKAFDISAVYEWGNTGFGFNLPVYYQPYQIDSGGSDDDAEGTQSRFLGRKIEKDLFVMDANAGINFVEPERTKLSFGASADFERLGNVSFQVDITDPESTEKVDDLLISLNITNEPVLEPALKGFLGQVDIVNRYANRGLDEVMKQGLDLAIKEAATGNNDPFVLVSDALAQVRSGPQQVISIITDEIQEPINNQLDSLERRFIAEVKAFEDLLSQTPNLAKEKLIAEIDKITAILDDGVSQANLISTTIDGAVAQAVSLVDNAQNSLSGINSAVLRIDNIIEKSASFAKASCGSGINVSGKKGYLEKIAVRFSKVRELAQTIKGADAIFVAVGKLVDDDKQSRRLDTAKQRIRDGVTELLGFVDTADEAIRQAVCDESNINVLMTKVTAVTGKIINGVALANTALENTKGSIANISTLHGVIASQVLKPVSDVTAAFAVIRERIVDTDIPASQVVAVSNQLKTNLSQQFSTARGGIGIVIGAAQSELAKSLNNLLPGAYMSPDQLREMLVTEVMSSAPIKEVRQLMDKHFAEIARSVNGIALQYVDQLNLVIKEALAGVTGPVNDALAEATSAIRGIGLKSASMDGFAVIAGNELERAHLAAEWTMGSDGEDDPTTFRAALDAESWSAKHKKDEGNTAASSCAVGATSSLLDVVISAYGLPINILASDIEIEKIYLGFTLKGNENAVPALTPIGIFGGISTMGQIALTDAKIIDPGFVAGLGELQTYIGAKAAVSFSSLEAEAAFLVGKVCPGPNNPLTDLDPDVAKFLPNLPPSGFIGAYLRGGATIPIVNPGSCALNLGVSADFGTWIFVGQPTTIGGLIGGGALGEVLCIAALKGKVTVAGSVNTDGGLSLTGDAWGAAGLGFCEPETWTSKKRSRDDSWCGTGDIETGATFKNGSWDISVPTPKAVF